MCNFKTANMDARNIAIINGVKISAVVKNSEIYLPVKPICEAIGISFSAQRIKIQEHNILSSVVSIIDTTGSDGKQYEMLCLPLKVVYGWLFSINPGKVASEAKANVEKYVWECYEVLYEHFSNASRKLFETNEAEIRLLKLIDDSIALEKQARQSRKESEAALKELRSRRLYPEPTLF